MDTSQLGAKFNSLMEANDMLKDGETIPEMEVSLPRVFPFRPDTFEHGSE
jgi:hypothetical protein